MKNALSYSPCLLCPRRCGINRDNSDTGYCGESAALRLACASIHRGEEPPISGTGEFASKAGGSGTIFVSGCNVGCVFCQNWQISGAQNYSINPLIPLTKAQRHKDKRVMCDGRSELSALVPPCEEFGDELFSTLGRPVDVAEFSHICLVLQEKGTENINIVTGSHAVPAIAEGITAAKAAGLCIPVLWNSSAYELPETLEMLAETVDVFLPDMKTLDSGIAGRFYAPDYPAIAAAAIEKMLAMRALRFNGPLLVSGVMIRHLVLPGYPEATREVLRWFADKCAGRALLSVMFQYTPVNMVDNVPDRYINQKEYDTVLGWLAEFGIEDGYCQELVPGNTDWLPDFEKTNPFPSDLSVPLWHWKNGFIY